MSVLLSGFPPSGGVALPPNRDVMRRIKVDFPHPESAARPMTTGPSRAARVTTRARVARRAVVGFLATTGAARAAVANAVIARTWREANERGRAEGRKRSKSFRTCVRDGRRRVVTVAGDGGGTTRRIRAIHSSTDRIARAAGRGGWRVSADS